MIARLLAASLLFVTAATLAVGCSAAAEDEFATENTTEVDDGKADLGGTYTYYTVTPDLRRCASPTCGGYWVERVNRTTTKCADGSFAARCYVAEVRWSMLGLTPAAIDRVVGAIHTTSVLVRATVAQKTFTGIGKLGELKPTEAWVGQGPNPPSGPFAKLEEIGTRCFAAPCPTFREKKLNDSATASLAELGWDEAGVDDDAIGPAIDELFQRDLIIAGDRFTVTGPAGTGKARTVTQFYVHAR